MSHFQIFNLIHNYSDHNVSYQSRSESIQVIVLAENPKYSPNVVTIKDQCRRRWASVIATLTQCVITLHIDPVLLQLWADVAGVGPALYQRWLNVWSLSAYYCVITGIYYGSDKNSPCVDSEH